MTNASSGDASTLPVDDIIGSVIHGVSAVCLLLALVTWVTLRLTDRLVTRRYLVLTFTIVASFLFHTIVLSSRLRAVSVAMATNPHPGTLNTQRPSPSPPFWTTTPRYGRTRRSGRPPMLKRALFDLEARAQPLLLRRAARSLKEDVYLRALGGDFVSDDALSNNVLNGDVLTGDALSDDVLSGDVLSGDVLSGDVLRGDVSRSLRFKPHSVRNKSSKFRFAELMRETHQSENGVSAISGGTFSVFRERETHHGVDASGVSNNVYPKMRGKHQFVQHFVDANGVSNNVYPKMQGKHQFVQHGVDVNGVSNNVYPKMQGKHHFVQHAVDASGRVYPKMRGNHQLGHHGMVASKVSPKLTRGKRQSPGSRNNDRDYVPGRAPPSDAPKPADGKRRRRPKNRGEKKQSTEPPREVSSDDDGSWVTLCQAGRAFYLLSDLSVYSFLFSMSLYYTLVVLGNPLTFNRLVTMFLFGLGVPVAFVTFTILMYVFLPAKAGFGSSCAVDAIVDEFHWATTAPKLLCVLLSLCLMTVSTYGFWRLHVPALNASSETFYAKQGVLKMLALLMVLSLAELYFLVTEYQRLYGLATTRFVVYFSTACCGAKGLALAILFCFADSEILHSTCCPPTTFYDGEPWLRAPPDHIRGRGGGGGGSNDSVKRWEDEDLAGNFDTVDAEQLSRWEEAERRRYDLDLQIPRVGGLRRWDEEEGWRVEEPVPIYRRITKDEQDVMRRGAGFEEPQPQWMAPQITSTPHHPQLMSRRPQSPLGSGFEVTQNPQLSFSQRSTTPKGSIGETPTLRVGERAPTPRSAEGVRLGERAPTPRNTEGIGVGERAPTPRSAEGVRLGERAITPRSADGVTPVLRVGERAPTPRSADGVTPALRVGARSPTPRSAEGGQGSLKLRSGDRTPTPKYGERPQTPKTQDGLQQFPPLPRIGGITRWQPDVMSTSAHSREGSETMPVADDTRKAGDRTPTPAELKLAARDRGERTEDAGKGIQEGGGRGGAVSPDKTGNQAKTGHHHHHHSQRPKSDDRSSEGTRRALASGAKRAPKRAWKDQEDTREWADNEEEDEEVAVDEGGGNEDEESTSGMNRMRNATPRHQHAPEFDLEFRSDHVSKAAQEQFQNAKSNYTSTIAQGQFENDDDDDLASAPSSALNDDSGESAATVLRGDFAGGVYPDDGDVYPDDSQADSEQLPPVDVAGYTPGSPRTPRRFEVTHEFWQPPQAPRTDRDPHAAKRHRREYENTRAVVAHAPSGDFQGSKAVPTEYPEIAGVYLPRELQWMQGRNREVVPCMADFQSGRQVGRDFQGTHGAREGGLEFQGSHGIGEGVPGTEFQSTHGSREARAREFGGTPTAKEQGRDYHPETVINAGYLPRELQGSPLQPGVIRELTPITRDLLGAGRGAYGDVNYGDVDPIGESEGGGNHEDSSTTTTADGAALTDLEYAQGVMDVLQAYKTTPDGGEHHTVQPWHADPDKPHFYTSDDWVI